MSTSARPSTLGTDFTWGFSKEFSNFSIHFPVKIPDTEERFLRVIIAFKHIAASLVKSDFFFFFFF